MNNLKYILVILSMLMLSNCAEEGEYDNIDAVLEPYFISFALEAENRGLEVDYRTAGISASFSQIADSGVAGQCNRQDDLNQIFIDVNFWKLLTEDEREFVVYHELGHCLLLRDHLNTSDNQGNCVSIMHSGAYSGCNMDYNDSNRQIYLDELFK